ncbi:hydrogenase maturation nickel metallochaperone HypA [uncultured Hyphomicrobium sp.]|uniref:hydrogenase maturation nickel metallochaperone HypA/HybF n=1 Tax=uncultured Hyphomicrobium sp. TaxID=194373 RepID=UPI0025F59F41|nr:hydrogenase maturation nickel metallochaperone HypA [uncultured Hyphomicrobium sp.]
MHELGITRNIVAIAADAAKGRRVLRVTLDVGRLAGVMTEAIQFCFETVAAGTALDGAQLDINEITGRAKCQACGSVYDTPTLFTACVCGSRACERLSGEELKIRSIELEEAA